MTSRRALGGRRGREPGRGDGMTTGGDERRDAGRSAGAPLSAWVRWGIALPVALALSGGCRSTPPPRLASAPLVFGGWIDEGGRGAWRFAGVAGELVAVDVHSEDFDPVVRLVAPDGGVIAWSDDVGQDTDAGLLRMLPVSGEYGVEVTPYILGSDGVYVALARLVEARSLELDAPVVLEGDGGPAVWSFAAASAAMVRVAVRSDEFDPFVRVVSLAGREIASDDDGGGGIDACVEVELPESGGYLVEVMAWHRGIRLPGEGESYELAVRTMRGEGAGAGCAGLASDEEEGGDGTLPSEHQSAPGAVGGACGGTSLMSALTGSGNTRNRPLGRILGVCVVGDWLRAPRDARRGGGIASPSRTGPPAPRQAPRPTRGRQADRPRHLHDL